MTGPADGPVEAAAVVQSGLLRAVGGGVHAFSTRRGGVSQPPYATLNLGQSVGDDPQAVQANRRRFFGAFGIAPPQVVRVRQVHGDGVLIVDPALAEREGFPQVLLDERYEFDALITDMAGLALVVSTADCLPILIHDPVQGAAAAVHAGWRSTAKRIVAKAVRALGKAYGTDPADCRVAIGPGIRGCCFEVDRPVIEAMGGALPTWEAHARPSRAGHWRIDLAGVNRAILQEAGVRPERVEDLDLCTACRTDLFFSHRAEKGCTGRMMILLFLNYVILYV